MEALSLLGAETKMSWQTLRRAQVVETLYSFESGGPSQRPHAIWIEYRGYYSVNISSMGSRIGRAWRAAAAMELLSMILHSLPLGPE